MTTETMTAPDAGAPIRQSIRAFIQGAIGVTDLRDEDDLFESGLVNSLFAVQLMTYLERTFAIAVEADDLDMDNFRSLAAAAAFVARKRGG